MMKVIALIGRPNCGKTQTLTLVYSLLLKSGGIQIPGTYIDLANRDFLDVLNFHGQKVGIVSQGDYAIEPYSVKNHLHRLESYYCDIAICACTTGKTKNKIKEAIETFPHHFFVSKHPSEAPELEQADNERYAMSVVDMVIEPQKTFPSDQLHHMIPQNPK